MANLAGVSQTFFFNNTGVEADPNAPYTNSGAAATLTLDEASGAGVVSEATGAFTGSISVDVEGSGQFIFNGANSIAGNVSILGGLLSVEADGALGSGNSIVFNNGAGFGALEALVDFTTTQTIVVENNSAATLEATKGVTLTATSYYDLVSAATLHIGSTTDTGMVALGASGSSIATGSSLSVDGGTLKILAGFSAVLAKLTGGVTVNGTLDLDGQSVTLNSLAGAGTISNSSATAATLTIDDSAGSTFSGTISGAVNLDDTGTGQVTLSGQTTLMEATIGSGDHLKIGNNTTNTTFSGNVVDNGTFEIDIFGSLTYAQQLSGSGTFELASASGEVTVSGDNSGFTGTIDVNHGTLSLTNTAALGAASDLSLGAVTVETTVDLTYAGSLDLGGTATLEATSGHTLTFSGYLHDFGTTVLNQDSQVVMVGSQIHIGSATDFGTVILGNKGGLGFAISGAAIFIDDGTLNVQSNLSLAGVAVSFTGTAGKLILNSTASTVSVNTATGASGEVDLNSAQVNFAGGGETVKFVSGSNDAATLSGTGSNWDALYGSNGAVTLNGALASIVGGDDVVTLQGSDSASLYNTAFHWDAVYGASETLYLTNAQASVVGGGDVLDLLGTATDSASLYNTGGAWDTVNGANGVVYLTNAQASILGGGDTVYLLGTATDYASLYNTGGAWDTVYGDDGVVYLTNAQASIVGGGNTTYLLGSASDFVSLYNTGYAWDTVYGSDADVYVTNGFASIVGGGNTIRTNSGWASLYNTDGAWDTVYSGDDQVILTNAQASVFGGNNTITFEGSATNSVSIYDTGGAEDVVTGDNGVVIINSAQAVILGYDDTVYMNGASRASESLTNTAFHDTYIYQENMGVSEIYGFTSHDAMQLSKADFASVQALFNDMSQSGADAIITLDVNDQITLTNVQKSSLSQSQFSLK